MTRWKVNIQLLPVKAHYFFFCAASAALVPFLPVLGKQLGVSEVEIGVVYAIAPVLGTIAKPTVGMLADRLKKRKNFFLFFILLTLMTSLCIAFLPQPEPERPVQFQCGNRGSNYLRQPAGGGRVDLSCASDSSWKEKFLEENRENNLTFVQDTGGTPETPLELCHVHCDIHSFLEGVTFCKNLVAPDRPAICDVQGMSLALNDTVEETQANVSTRSFPASPSLPTDPDFEEDIESFEDSKAYRLKFDALIKIAHVDLVLPIDELFLPVDRVRFEDFTEFEKFACIPNEVVLRKCFINCPSNVALNSHMERILGEDAESFQSTTSSLFRILVVISTVALAVVNSLSDALCFQVLVVGNKPHHYGRQRLLAAIGWGGSTLLAGYLIDRGSQDLLVKDYTPCFYMLGALFILDLIMSYKWEIKEVDKPKSFTDNMCTLVSDVQIIIFFFACVLVGMCTGIHWYFLFWLLEDVALDHCEAMQWIKLLQGIMVAVQCCAEIPFFYYAGWFIKKLGHVHCLSLVLFAFGIRLIIYSYLVHPWAFVPVELFQGITFGLFYSVMATYASKISPKGSEAAVQGIVGAGFEGIGIAAGSLVAGVLFKTLGGQITFRIFGVGAIFFCGLHVLLTYLLRKKRIYGIPISDTEPDGQEMYRVNGVAHDVETESE